MGQAMTGRDGAVSYLGGCKHLQVLRLVWNLECRKAACGLDVCGLLRLFACRAAGSFLSLLQYKLVW